MDSDGSALHIFITCIYKPSTHIGGIFKLFDQIYCVLKFLRAIYLNHLIPIRCHGNKRLFRFSVLSFIDKSFLIDLSSNLTYTIVEGSNIKVAVLGKRM